MIQGRITLQILLFNLVTRIPCRRWGLECQHDGVFWLQTSDITSVVREWEEFWAWKSIWKMIGICISNQILNRTLMTELLWKPKRWSRSSSTSTKKPNKTSELLIKLFYKTLNPKEELLDLLERNRIWKCFRVCICNSATRNPEVLLDLR